MALVESTREAIVIASVPEHTDRNLSKVNVLADPIACKVAEEGTHSRCRKDGTDVAGGGMGLSVTFGDLGIVEL